MKENFLNIIVLLLWCACLLSCAEKRNSNKISEDQKIQKIKEKVIIVKIPPLYDGKLSREENFWRFDHFLFPQEPIPDPIPKGFPNYDAIFTVSVESNGNIKLNMSEQGNVSDTGKLQNTLRNFFEERKANGVYESNSQRIVKAVGIVANDSVKYGDLLKVVETIQESGADPIVLRFANDAGNFKNYFKNQ